VIGSVLLLARFFPPATSLEFIKAKERARDRGIWTGPGRLLPLLLIIAVDVYYLVIACFNLSTIYNIARHLYCNDFCIFAGGFKLAVASPTV
jgi:hypothetical protein